MLRKKLGISRAFRPRMAWVRRVRSFTHRRRRSRPRETGGSFRRASANRPAERDADKCPQSFPTPAETSQRVRRRRRGKRCARRKQKDRRAQSKRNREPEQEDASAQTRETGRPRNERSPPGNVCRFLPPTMLFPVRRDKRASN
ncbi:hypothetical protein HMPREF0972_00712 [Actinomyces sp. oral taxon 848 str. F0332]|nr:hypothetical protein HMPREF0972_00712 [Actinomyces sp. oral taxon 848 str. F0332]